MSVTTLTFKQSFLLERWQQIRNDPDLDQYDNAYRIETDGDGEVLMSPRPPNQHNRKAFAIAFLLQERLGSAASGETRILTDQGIKVADAVWCPPNRWPQDEENDIFVVAPDICIEVLSPRNTKTEIAKKRELYFAAGAREVWICDRNLKIIYFGPRGKMTKSELCPDFPSHLEL